jgi:hypothetical protein
LRLDDLWFALAEDLELQRRLADSETQLEKMQQRLLANGTVIVTSSITALLADYLLFGKLTNKIIVNHYSLST